MNCMKCGRDIEETQVFCPACLADMQKYPVRPGTAVLLPRRPESTPLRKVLPKRKVLSPEEQVKRLRKKLRRLWLGILGLLVVIVLLAYPYVKDLLDGQTYLPGQNYTSILSTAPTGEGE